MKKKKIIIVSAVNALLLIIIGIVVFNCHSISQTLLNQQAADFWAGESEERFAQISCFFPQDEMSTKAKITSFRATIDSKLIEAGIEPKEQGSFWTDAYSTKSTVQVEGDKGKSAATAVGVGGDYFLFHPYYLMSGSYLTDDTVMQDRVVLDYELAWKLFGGTQLEGMTVKIGGKPYYIAGVVKRETDKYSQKAFLGDPVIFMPYDAFSDGETEIGINCYELAMLDPISDFAETTVKNGLAGETGVVIENSKRYSFESIFSVLKNFGERSMVKNAVVYPYWENAARLTETYIARNYIIIALLAVFPLICLVYLAVIFIKHLIKWIKLLAFKTWDAWDDRYARREARKLRNQKKLEAKEKPQEQDETDADIQGRKKRFKIKLPTIKKHSVQNDNEAKVLEQIADAEEVSDNPFLDKELALDIESIVREVMSESELKNKE